MYLLVFVTLVIALTGIYTQVIMIQAARLFSNQTAIAREMIIWHSTARALATNAGVTPAPGATGCSLTSPAPPGLGVCQDAGFNNVTVGGAQPGDIPSLCSGAQTVPCWTRLPPGYQTAPYKFYSVYYQPAAGQGLIVTFVPPPVVSAANPPPGNITLPGTGANAITQIGQTMSDLIHQFRNSHISPLSYGMVVGTNLVTSTISNGTTATSFQYALPTAGCPGACVVPVNSIGYISTP